MSQNLRKLTIQKDTFSDICGLISLNTNSIKQMLYQAVHNDMIRCEVVIENISSGHLNLRSKTTFVTDSPDSLVISGIYRSSPFGMFPISKFIQELDAQQMQANVSNQIELISPTNFSFGQPRHTIQYA